MVKLRVPSLQHLARNWRNDAQWVKRLLVDLARNPPLFSYDPLFSAVRDMLVFGHPYEEIAEGIRRGIKQEGVRDNLLSVLPLIHDYFRGITPTFVQAVDSRYYPVGRGLMVPFRPPLIYGSEGRIHFPWFSFWRRNPLESKRLSLFVSVVDDVLLQDPDLEDAEFVILDFSASAQDQPRELKVLDAREIPRVSKEDKVAMLSVFAEGYSLAQAELAADTMPSTKGPPDDKPSSGDQPDLFDDR
jgi:hypothetical protein